MSNDELSTRQLALNALDNIQKLIASLSPLNTAVDADGDSLTYGDHSSNPPYTSVLGQLQNQLSVYPNFGSWKNYGVNGQKMTQMLSDQQSQVINDWNKSLFSQRIVIVGGNTNDLYQGETVDNMINNIKTYCLNLVSAGIKPIVVTLTAGYWDYPNGLTATQGEVVRLQYNSRVRTSVFTDFKAAGFVDLALNPQVGIKNSSPDYTIFSSEGLHFTDYGYSIIMNLIKPAVLAVANGELYGLTTVVGATTNNTGSGTINNYSNIPFSSVSTGVITNSSITTVTGKSTDEVYGNLGLSSLKLPAGQDGRIMLSFGSQRVVFAFSTTNALQSYTVMPFALHLAGDYTLSSVINGNFWSDGTKLNNQYCSLVRNSGVIKLQYSSNGTDWTNYYTFPQSNTGDLFVVFDLADNGQINVPQGSNLN